MPVGEFPYLPVWLILQFGYMLLVGTFPFNAFLAGLLCSLAFFSLTGMHIARAHTWTCTLALFGTAAG